MDEDGIQNCDVLIAGGGLAGCLIALALAEKRPDLDVRLIESGERLGGNHVWSFFDSDVAAEHRWLVEPLICHRWQGYDVAFPTHTRTLDSVYNSIESERLDEVVRARIAPEKIIRTKIMGPVSYLYGDNAHYPINPIWRYQGLDIQSATWGKRERMSGHVIDARGPGDLSTLDLGWQKFVGIEVKVPGGHGLTLPIVMDASVEQIGGYRFVYCLPFDAETVFIEDTYYSDTPDLDVPAIRERIIDYARAKGWQTNGGGREEMGVLPVVIGGDFDGYWDSTGPDIAKAGLRSGMFHATTGYSLPNAVRLAARLAEDPFQPIKPLAEAHWRKQGYYRLLDKMLFRAAEPAKRYIIFERFYRLSPRLIERFYSGQSTLADKARILIGKPPVPIHRAIKAILGFK